MAIIDCVICSLLGAFVGYCFGNVLGFNKGKEEQRQEIVEALKVAGKSATANVIDSK